MAFLTFTNAVLFANSINLILIKKITLSTTAINHSFEAEKNRKALMYTTGLVGIFLIIAIYYTWPLLIPPIPPVQDLIDVNLGNEQEGMGNIQPLVKGERAPDNQSRESHKKS